MVQQWQLLHLLPEYGEWQVQGCGHLMEVVGSALVLSSSLTRRLQGEK